MEKRVRSGRSAGPPGDELGAVLREVLGRGPLSGGVNLGRLVRGWDQVVGPDLARVTAPRGLRDGVLWVGASTAGWAVQVRFLAVEIGRRANRSLGCVAVREVRVVVRPQAPKPLGHSGFGVDRGSSEGPPTGPPSDRI